MAARNLHIAAYDVSSPSRLRRALNITKRYAIGGQKSVYECFLAPADVDELLSAMADILDPEEDRFMLLRLDPRGGIHTLGIGVRPADPDFFFVG